MARTRNQTHTLYTGPHASQISFVTQQENPPSKDDDFRLLKASGIAIIWNTPPLNVFNDHLVQILERYKKHDPVKEEHFEQKVFYFAFICSADWILELFVWPSSAEWYERTVEEAAMTVFTVLRTSINVEWLWKTKAFCLRRVNILGGGGQWGQMPLLLFFVPKNSFLLYTELK